MLPDPMAFDQGVLIVDGEEERVEPMNPYGCELDDMAAAIRGERARRAWDAPMPWARHARSRRSTESAAEGVAVRPNG